MVRDHFRTLYERVRYDGPGEATYRTHAGAAFVIWLELTVRRVYSVDDPVDIVTMAHYESELTGHETALEAAIEIATVGPLLAFADAGGRLWMALLWWVPEGAAKAVLTVSMASVWLLAIDFAVRTAADNRDAFNYEVGPS